ncbi:hypothetical protein HDU83_003095 [Entophlyctis luteolus]|nr:hypothetical protein HDU82_002645 [Entophlyctis luteolus]KAJ3346443.1 hypothetical protein HDU83_003095 [Entophlyctis luteolus]KAJ3385274.1 hypothetical protein HDU84_002378 [Entophlyctis sp. JEL0112]
MPNKRTPHLSADAALKRRKTDHPHAAATAVAITALHPRASKQVAREFTYLHVRLTIAGSGEPATQQQFLLAVERALRDLFGIVGSATRMPMLLFFSSSLGEAVLRCAKKSTDDVRAALTLASICINRICRFDILDAQNSIKAFDSIDFITPSIQKDGGEEVAVNDEWVVSDDMADACGFCDGQMNTVPVNSIEDLGAGWMDVIDREVADVYVNGLLKSKLSAAAIQ